MTIRVGLVGYGMAGLVFHAPLITSVEGLTLAAVVSSNTTKVQRDYPNVSVVPTFDVLLARDDIELVVIATPNGTHYEFARQALEAGKHVVVDKPFTIQTGEAEELIALAKRKNVVLSVFQNRRWDNDFLTIRALLETGMLGEIANYEAHYDRYRPVVHDRWREQALPGSGMLYDLGAHVIDQALVLFGTPESVWADVRAQRQGAVTDDYFHIMLTYPQKQTVILHSGSIVRELPPHFQLHGSKGSFIKYGLDSQEDALKAGKRPGDAGWGDDDTSQYGTLTVEVGDLTIDGKVPTLPGHYETFYQGMVAAITQDSPAPVNPHDARNTIRVIECALQSSKEQRAIVF
jgi:scyllo-inositol 2-dehydrogenase (NADP+)